MNLVKKYLSMGLSLRDVYKLLKDQGYLSYVDRKGSKHVLSYTQFWRKVRQRAIKTVSERPSHPLTSIRKNVHNLHITETPRFR